MQKLFFTCVAIMIMAVPCYAAKTDNTATVELPALSQEAQGMDNIIKDISGYLTMQGSTIKLNSSHDILHGLRADGIRFEVFFKADSQEALVQCHNNKTAQGHRPSQKHLQNGRRFNKKNTKKLRLCAKSLATSVRRSIALLN